MGAFAITELDGGPFVEAVLGLCIKKQLLTHKPVGQDALEASHPLPYMARSHS